MANCRMTEAQVLEAAFANSNIESWIGVKGDEHDMQETDTPLFRFSDKAWRKVKNRIRTPPIRPFA
jgi:hypothetical protein